MLTRRSLLQLGGAATLSLGAGLLPRTAHADPDTPGPALSPDPEIYPFRLGTLEAFIIHDGLFINPSVQPLLAPEGKPADVNRLLTENFLPTDRVVISINVLVLRSGGSDVTLLDTGGGAALGASAGRLMRGLTKIGITPDQVTNIVITHAHSDHIAGLADASGNSAFPKAKVHINKTEADFWLGASPDLSQMRVPADGKAGAIGAAKKFLTTVAGQTQRVVPGTILPGIEIIEAYGHTPGHAAVLITSGSDKLLHIADAVHSYALQFPHPEWTIAFDAIPSQAIESRRRLFARASSERLKVLAYHLPFPGIGHIRTAGRAYEWVPQPWVS